MVRSGKVPAGFTSFDRCPLLPHKRRTLKAKPEPPVDVSRFQPLVSEFLRYAATDWRIAEAISRTAVNIERKRVSAKARRIKEKNMAKTPEHEPPADAAIVEDDVNPEADGEPVVVSRDSFSLPDHPNEAADPNLPHEERRPTTKAERKDMFYGTNES